LQSYETESSPRLVSQTSKGSYCCFPSKPQSKVEILPPS
jgi:hypothetical protein